MFLFGLACIAFFGFVVAGAAMGWTARRRGKAHEQRIEKLTDVVAQLRNEVIRLRMLQGQASEDSRAENIIAEHIETESSATEPVSTKAAEASPVATTSQPPIPESESDPELAAQLSTKALVDSSPIVDAFKEHWMVWIGGISVALAGIFMVSYSITAGLLGPTQQFALALLSGLGLHAGAEYMRRRNMGTDPVFAAMAGGGSITLFAALLAGIHHFHILSPMVGFAGLAIVALATMALALIHGPILAILGLSGAYFVPLLIGSNSGNVPGVLGYSFIITLASLLLMRYVYREWLWIVTVVGALLWWVLMALSLPIESTNIWYLGGLIIAWSVLSESVLANRVMVHIQIPQTRLKQAVLLTLACWIWALAAQPALQPLFWSSLLILPVATLIPQSRSFLSFLPWSAVCASAIGWLLFAISQDAVNINDTADNIIPTLPTNLHADFIKMAFAAAALSGFLGAWQWLRDGLGEGLKDGLRDGLKDGLRDSSDRIFQHRWPSLTLLSPIVWLALVWLLVHGQQPSFSWASGTFILGAAYAVLAWFMLRKQDAKSATANNPATVWPLMAMHVCYSLATTMLLREASLTLALAFQLVSLTWLARRYQLPALHTLLKIVLAIVITCLTLNPWLQEYASDQHWSLWTYGGATLLAFMASRLADEKDNIRLWLEAATLHLLVLFLGAEMRYWLYDGDLWVHEYSLTEATLNTLLWGGLAITYVQRAKVSESLTWLYTLFAKILLVMSSLSYATSVLFFNPWWSEQAIGSTAIFNILLPAYGLPVILALLIHFLPSLNYRNLALKVAGFAFGLFTLLEIRHIWQASKTSLDFPMLLHYPISEGELYTYSVVGLIYAIIAIVFATQRQHAMLYKVGMILLGLVIAKIFLIDTSGLQGLWRVAAFMGLGLSLLGLSWMHSRLKAKQQSPQAEDA
ncbi:MAG: DUF2339 domain-containing protein [Oleibacter sp.]|nr:DUF2339 domain-containing protein [Thalassolituus sp.]